jgi:hypothetical protein
MKKPARLLCLAVLMMMLCTSGVRADTQLADPLSIVAYDRSALTDWLPSYRLTTPGTLMELSHTEGLITLSIMELGNLTPKEYLSALLDRAGESVVVSDAEITPWKDPFLGDGSCLSYSYTYPYGDEVHLMRVWSAGYPGGMLIDLCLDVWGAEAEALLSSACASLIDSGFSVIRCEKAVEKIAVLTDIVTDDSGTVCIRLSEDASVPGEFSPLSDSAIVLFPNPDDPSLLYPVDPTMACLVDAVLTYEESSDSPALFRVILEDDVILYMEYHHPILKEENFP